MKRSQVKILKEFTAEMVGTAVLLMFGCGSVAQSLLSNKENGNMLSINLGWGLGVLMAIMIAGPISGAHLNPAVSVALATVGKFSPLSVLHYIAAQYLGAWLGSAVVLLTYRDAFLHFAGGDWEAVTNNNQTAGVFVTAPNQGISNLGGAIDQVVGTALLLLTVSSVGHNKNQRVSSILGPLIVSLAVVAIGICFGHNAGYAINPARDLGPRLMILCFGWGRSAFTASHGWWWIPVLCCHLGGIIGAAIHLVLIEWEWKGVLGSKTVQEEKEEKEDV